MHPHYSAITELLHGKARAAIPLNLCVMKPTQQYQQASVRLGRATINFLEHLSPLKYVIQSLWEACAASLLSLCVVNPSQQHSAALVMKPMHPNYRSSVWWRLHSLITDTLCVEACTATSPSLCLAKLVQPHHWVSVCLSPPPPPPPPPPMQHSWVSVWWSQSVHITDYLLLPHSSLYSRLWANCRPFLHPPHLNPLTYIFWMLVVYRVIGIYNVNRQFL